MIDRDGVINKDNGYVHTAAQWEWCPGAIESISALKSSGYNVIICTNQSGVGRKMYSVSDFWVFNHWVKQQYTQHMNQTSGHPLLDGYPMTVACFHLPTAGCECRKPKPGMWAKIEPMIGRFDTAASWFLDDKFENLDFGRSRMLNLGWITSETDDVREPLDYHVFGSLHHFAEHILQRKIPWTPV